MPSIVSFRRNVGHAAILIILFSIFLLGYPCLSIYPPTFRDHSTDIIADIFVLIFHAFSFILVLQATAVTEYQRKENMANMEKTQYYVKLLRDEILNDILNYSSHYFSNYNWKKVVKLPVNTIL